MAYKHENYKSSMLNNTSQERFKYCNNIQNFINTIRNNPNEIHLSIPPLQN